jgi:hypothetical protein
MEAALASPANKARAQNSPSTYRCRESHDPDSV